MTIELHCRVSRNIRMSITPVGDTKIVIEEANNPAMVLDESQNFKLLGCLAPFTISCAGATDNTGCISFDGPVTAYIDALGVEIHATDEADLIAKVNALTATTNVSAAVCVNTPKYDFVIPMMTTQDNGGEFQDFMSVGDANVGLMVDYLMPEALVDGEQYPAMVMTGDYIQGNLFAYNGIQGHSYANGEWEEFIPNLEYFITKSLVEARGGSMPGPGDEIPTKITFEEITDPSVFQHLPQHTREAADTDRNKFTITEPLDSVNTTFRWFGVNIDLSAFPPASTEAIEYPTHLVLRRPKGLTYMSSLGFDGESKAPEFNQLFASVNSLVLADTITIPIGGGEKIYDATYTAEDNDWQLKYQYLQQVYAGVEPMLPISGYADVDYTFGNPIDASLTAIDLFDFLGEETESMLSFGPNTPKVYVFNFRGGVARLMRFKIASQTRRQVEIRITSDLDYRQIGSYVDSTEYPTANTNHFPYAWDEVSRQFRTYKPVSPASDANIDVEWTGANQGGITFQTFTCQSMAGGDYDILVLVPELSTVTIKENFL